MHHGVVSLQYRIDAGIRCIIAFVAFAIGCSSRGNGALVTASREQFDPVLHTELLRREVADQTIREELISKLRRGGLPDSLFVARQSAVDAENTAWLTKIISSRGWPGPAMAGADGARAAFLLVQHADRDTTFQARVLPMIERAYAQGQATGQQVALLTDRLAGTRGRPQIYGTQADLVGGRLLLRPIADSATVDTRRAAAGLPPLRDYVRMLDSMYAARPKP